MRRRTIAGLVGVLAVVCGAECAMGQEDDGERARLLREQQRQMLRDTEAAAREASIIADSLTVTFSFDGGTAVEYAAAVQSASGANRVVVMPGCEGFAMPAVELSGVSVEGALSPLRYARALDLTSGLGLKVAVEGDVFIVMPVQKGRQRQEREPRTAVFSLAEMLASGAVRAEDVLTAVETALELSGEGAASMRYHPETRLLMVRGGDSTLQAVDGVLDGVLESAEVMHEGANAGDQIRWEIAERRAELEAQQRQLEEYVRYVAQVEKLAEQGDSSPLEVLHTREEMIEREARLAELLGQLRVLEERLEREERGGGREGVR